MTSEASPAERAIERAIRRAREAGLDAERGEIIAEGVNVLVRLEPASLLARVSDLIDVMRVDGAWPWYVRDVAVTSWLAERQVLAPRPVAGPFREDDGISVSLWEWLEHDPYVNPPERELGASLAELHAVLANYDADLPDVRDVIGEVAALAEQIREVAELRASADAFERSLDSLMAALDRIDPWRTQALHGDTHAGNVVGVGDALVWIDYEDVCRGPVEFDLACAIALGVRSTADADALLEGYGGEVDLKLLELMVDARRLQLATLSAVLIATGHETPDRRARVDRWMATYAR